MSTRVNFCHDICERENTVLRSVVSHLFSACPFMVKESQVSVSEFLIRSFHTYSIYSTCTHTHNLNELPHVYQTNKSVLMLYS